MGKKLYQHVVSEPEVKGQYEKIKAETLKNFKGKDLFNGFIKVYSPKTENGEPLPTEQKEVVTTVPERLAWTESAVAKIMDYEITRDTANCHAKADLVVAGKTIAANVPATTLLALEKRLKEVREYYDAMPTLDLSKKWVKSNALSNTYTYDATTYRTAKKTSAVVLYPATDKHPAQVKDVVEDITIGTFQQTVFSGEVHPSFKATTLSRIDILLEAVKSARQTANEVQTAEVKIGKAVFDFIHDR